MVTNNGPKYLGKKSQTFFESIAGHLPMALCWQMVPPCWPNGRKRTKTKEIVKIAGSKPSKSCLESLLKYVEHAGLPEKKSATDMRNANRSLLAQANAYGPLLLHQDLVCLDGSNCKIQFVNLLSFVHYSYKQGGSSYNAFKSLPDEHDNLLGLCLYSDELCPGNPLAASTNRKCLAILAGFKEVGPLLSNEFAWVTICTLRSTVVAGLEADFGGKWNMLVYCYSPPNNMLVKSIEG